MRRALDIVLHGVGIVAFTWPFVLPPDAAAEASAHATEAPLLVAALATLLLAQLLAVRLSASQVALLGVLAALNAILRLPGGFGGASPMFVLPILVGAVFGARFGFLLGATSMLASALITGGVGPWLPFQAWALGWVGAGGALLRARRAGMLPSRTGLAVYGWIVGIGFGVAMNLWFWPYLGGASDLSFAPGASILDNLTRYWRFEVATSLPWDSMRAIGNVVLLVTVGRPVLRLLIDARDRFETSWAPTPVPEAGLASTA